MTFAAIANPRNGHHIIPSINTIDQAVNTPVQIQDVSRADQTTAPSSSSTIPTNTADLPPLINSSRPGNSSYPIVGLYYASLHSDKLRSSFSSSSSSLSSSERNATLDFIKWIIDRNKGQQALSEVQYPSIYDNATLMSHTQSTIEKTIEKAR